MGVAVGQSVQRLGYRLDDWDSLPGRSNDGIFSLYHCIHNSAGAYPPSYPRGTRGSYPRGKVGRTCS